MAFHWTAGELRVGDAQAKRLKDGVVRQLRPFTHAQPWGIFLVEFADAEVYRTALRQVLRGLLPSRRGDPNLPAWQHENLLFLMHYGRLPAVHVRPLPRPGDNWRPRLRALFEIDATDGLDADELANC